MVPSRYTCFGLIWALSVYRKLALNLWRLHCKSNCLNWSEATYLVSSRKAYSFLCRVVPWKQVWPTQNSSFDQFKCSLGERCSVIHIYMPEFRTTREWICGIFVDFLSSSPILARLTEEAQKGQNSYFCLQNTHENSLYHAPHLGYLRSHDHSFM